jgi:3-hydroxyacyl-CoA dehydrogenase/enoyl-CoA hydratase/3-hydroxybutyryl-CoA epimerase
VVIEAIFENADAKRALYAELEPKLKPDALLATNTSSIKIETLAEKLQDPSRLVGIHFFNPVAQMQLVEVVQGAGTRPAILRNALVRPQARQAAAALQERPGFVVNRILMPYINEALFALADGVPAAVIDLAGTRFGMPMGPIELADVVGLDVSLHVGRVLAEAFHRPVPDILVQKVSQKKFGRKSGEGFYLWKDGKPKRRRRAGRPIFRLISTDRLILPMLNEAAATLREGVVEDADLLDAGAIFATGFAPFRGGPSAIRENAGH